MANGMYTCPERVVRDGHLAAFAGEVMTMDEAAARGLLADAAAEGHGKTKPELVAEAESLGIEVPPKATKAQIAELIAARAAEGEVE